MFLRLKNAVFIYKINNMDLLTDILNNFFVSSNVTKNKNTTVITSDDNNKSILSTSSSSLKTSIQAKISTISSDNSSSNSSSNSSFERSQQEKEHTLSSYDVDNKYIDCKIEKYILRGKDIYKKHIMIINEDRKDNIVILGDILDKISKLENVKQIYNNKIYIMTSENNMTKYRKVFLENPYLYFMDYDIRRGFYESKEIHEKKTIYIVDYELLSSEKINQLLKRQDIQLIIVGNVYNSEIGQLFKNIGNNSILINKKSKIESLQKQFYKNIIKQICHNNFINFEEYIKNINDENLDARWVVINGDKLMYN
jgi:hypothetical protein